MQTSAAARIPVEIWIKIAIILRDQLPCPHRLTVAVDKRCSRSECADQVQTRLFALSTTCRFLHTLLKPRLYETVSLGYQHPQSDDVKRELRDYALMKKPKLLSFTRNLRVYKPVGLQESLVDSFLSQLTGIVAGLRSLTLNNVSITSSIVGLLLATENLEELVVQGCGWEKLEERNWSRGRFGRRLKALILCADGANEVDGREENGRPPRYLQLVVPGLVELVCSSAQLEDIVPAMEDRTLSLYHLTLLEIRMRKHSVPILLRFLPFCQNVENFGIGGIGSQDLDPLPPNVLPRLRHVREAPIFSNTVVCRSEIDSFHMTLESRPIEILPLGFPTLKTLILDYVEWSENTISYITIQCPALEILDITSYGPHGVLPHWIKTRLELEIGGLSRLRKLFLRWYPPWRDNEEFQLGLDISYPLPYAVETERAVAANIKATCCPELEELGLSPGHIWIYHPADQEFSPAIRSLRPIQRVMYTCKDGIGIKPVIASRPQVF